MNKYNVDIEIFNGYIHYYLNNDYLGLLVFNKGELSDHRAIIRKNRMDINKNNLYKVMRTSLFALLNHYLSERLFMEGDLLQKTKTEIVKTSEKKLKESVEKILNENKLGNNNDQ